MNKNRLLLIIGVTLLLVLGIIYWRSNRILTQFPAKVREARELHHQGEIGKSIPLLETLIMQAPTKREEARLKLILASDYSKINYQKGIALWKEVFEDSLYPSWQRGLALQYVADTYMLGSRSVRVADTVFFGNPYAGFLDYAKSSPILEGIRILYAQSFLLTGDISTFPINHYRVAEWYLNEILNNPEKYPDPVTSEFYQMAQDHYTMGNNAMGSFLATQPDESQILYVKWLQAMIAGYLAAFAQDTNLRDEADTAFTRLFADNAHIDSHTRRQNQWAHFYHALFLHQHYGASRAADIVNDLDYLLSPELSNTPFNEFLAKLAFPGSEYKWLSKNTVALAEYHPDFAEFLKTLGWKL